MDLLDRTSTAERVADIVRTRILEGQHRPGERLNEAGIVTELRISRNTLREAYRLLIHEGLLSQELNRGMFVRVPSVDDVADIYRVRRLVECEAVRRLDAAGVRPGGTAHPVVLLLSEIVARAEAAQASPDPDDGEMLVVGTANIHFHQQIAGLSASTRIDALMRRLLAELRLVFFVMEDPHRFYEPYVARNRELLDLIAAGDGPAAEHYLAKYLTDAETELIEAYSALP